MSAPRFLHSSDLHLGRAFGGYLEGIRHRLREARQRSCRISGKIVFRSKRRTATLTQKAEKGDLFSAQKFEVGLVKNVVNGESEENGDI